MTNITGVILAGGRATRMGGQDKGLLPLNDKSMVEYVIAALRPQVNTLLISANRHQAQYAKIGNCPVLSDTFGHYDGPLAGMATALAKAETDYVLFVPCDSPLLSPVLAERLLYRIMSSSADVSVADDGKRIQPVFSLFRRSVLVDLLAYLENGERSINRFLTQQNLVRADFSDVCETFLNVNSPKEQAILLKKIMDK
ncbi:MAG: molybdenum cofactor guanylyltransferase [Thiotrichaceae bacterium]|nr:molybdenum cofactor guanylyltransferase [Thiotrichaceae bacterium]